MNIAEDRTVVVEMVNRPYSSLQLLGGVGFSGSRGCTSWAGAPGQPAGLTAGSLAACPALGAWVAGCGPEAVTALQARAL